MPWVLRDVRFTEGGDSLDGSSLLCLHSTHYKDDLSSHLTKEGGFTQQSPLFRQVLWLPLPNRLLFLKLFV